MLFAQRLTPFSEPGQERGKKGDIVLIDMWAKLDRPNSVYYDITWMGFCGQAPSSAFERVFAVVREAPSGGAIELNLRQGSTGYCTLTIPDGATISNVVNGFGLTPLAADSRLNLDIASVPGAPNTLPGRNLTVTIRL